ncbi:hypothetical protein V6N11_014124 [Hibiscus sabdariffa]|uniref:Uncharacterized protein n=1 Tax=Hibiscus sabdariffa TaxID=183260 RepID=A0ABR2AFW6_9ROSI
MESALSAENQVIGLSLAMVGTFPLVAVSVPNQIQLQNKKKDQKRKKEERKLEIADSRGMKFILSLSSRCSSPLTRWSCSLGSRKGIATSDASKEALAYTYTTATLIDIDECGLRTLIPEPSSSLVFMPTCRDAKEEGRLTTQTLTNQWP